MHPVRAASLVVLAAALLPQRALISATEPVPYSLTANRSLTDAFGVNGTPAFVWKSADEKVQATAGMPPLSELPAITSLPEQPEPDHELDRFR